MKKYILRFLSWIGFALKTLFKCRSKDCGLKHEHTHIQVAENDVVIIIEGDDLNAKENEE